MPVSEWLEKDETLHEETLPRRILDVIVESYEDKEAQADEPPQPFPNIAAVQSHESAFQLQDVNAS